MKRFLLLAGLFSAPIFSNQELVQPEDYFTDAKDRLAIGEHYFWGQGVEKNHHTARRYFEGVMKMGEHNPKAAARAECWLGETYYLENPLEEPLHIAQAHFEKVAEQSYDFEVKTYALMRLGMMAMDGEGRAVDLAQARKYFERAITAGAGVSWTFIRATPELCLGVLMFNAHETHNYSKARELILNNVAHVSNYHQLMGTFVLGKMFLTGIGGPKDALLAVQCYKRVIEISEEFEKQQVYWRHIFSPWHIEAVVQLGVIYAQGTEVKKNIGLAKSYLAMARHDFLFSKLDNKLRTQAEDLYNKYCG